MIRAILATAAFAAVLAGVSNASHAAPSDDEPQVGRYQLVAPSGYDERLFVLDTATGQCWSKAPGEREWRKEGNPVRGVPAAEPPEPEELALDLPRKRVDLTIRQRRSKAIPGSDDRIRIHLGDITGGQVIVAVRAYRDEGRFQYPRTLFDDTSMNTGDVVDFRVGEEKFYLRLKELNNALLGGDFAVLEVSSEPSEEEAGDDEDREERGEDEGDGEVEETPDRDE